MLTEEISESIKKVDMENRRIAGLTPLFPL